MKAYKQDNDNTRRRPKPADIQYGRGGQRL